eukprot:scaffold28851_cov56-Attheya_sp.AAC.6
MDAMMDVDEHSVGERCVYENELVEGVTSAEEDARESRQGAAGKGTDIGGGSESGHGGGNPQTYQDKGQPATIKHIPQNKGNKIVGVLKAGDLKERAEFKHLLNKTLKFTCSIVACPVRPHEIWKAYNTIYLASIMYPLASKSLSFKELEK